MNKAGLPEDRQCLGVVILSAMRSHEQLNNKHFRFTGFIPKTRILFVKNNIYRVSGKCPYWNMMLVCAANHKDQGIILITQKHLQQLETVCYARQNYVFYLSMEHPRLHFQVGSFSSQLFTTNQFNIYTFHLFFTIHIRNINEK